MKVRMKTSLAGETASLRPGQIVEVDDQIGLAWIEADIAADANAVEEYRFEPSLPIPPSPENDNGQPEESEASGSAEFTETVPPADAQAQLQETQGKAGKGKGSSRKKL